MGGHGNGGKYRCARQALQTKVVVWESIEMGGKYRCARQVAVGKGRRNTSLQLLLRNKRATCRMGGSKKRSADPYLRMNRLVLERHESIKT